MEKPDSKMTSIRRAWPEIVATLDAGHSLKGVCECLNADGVAVEYKTLRAYVSILRREQSQRSMMVPDKPFLALSFKCPSVRFLKPSGKSGLIHLPPPWNTSAKCADSRTSPGSRQTPTKYFEVACPKTPSAKTLKVRGYFHATTHRPIFQGEGATEVAG